jgi:polysulfide reductase chain C
MAGGTYATAFLVDHLRGDGNRPLLRIATYLGIPFVLIGVLLLVTDLGNPSLFWHLLTQFKILSPMSMGTWILLSWVVIAVTMVSLWQIENSSSKDTAGRRRKAARFLGSANLVFAVLLMVYSGVLPAVSNKVLWAGTIFLPALFVASAISMGLAILVIAVLSVNAISNGNSVALKSAIKRIVGPTDWAIPSLTVAQTAVANAIAILIELGILVGLVLGIATSATAGAGEALDLLITGALAIPFWLGVILVGLLMPLALYVINWRKNVEARTVRRAMAVSSICIILGGFLLRAVIFVGGQII